VTDTREHLSDADLLDALEGGPGGASARHLAACSACAARLAEAREGLALARAASVPEPPAVYWQSFPRRVAEHLDAAGPQRRPWGGWLWPAFATAAALVVAVLLVPRPVPEPPVPPATTPARALAAWSALPAAEKDPALPVLEALGPDLDPALDCGGVAECVAELSDEESQDLVRLLRPGVKDSPL
jgi:hypothetical protein